MGQAHNDSGLALAAQLSLMPFAAVGVDDLKTLSLHVFDEIQNRGLTSDSALGEGGFNLLAVAMTYESSFLDGALEYASRQTKGVDTSASATGVTLNGKLLEERASLFFRYLRGNTLFQTTSGFKPALLQGGTAPFAQSVLTVGPTWSFIKGKLATGLLYETRPALVDGQAADNQVLWTWAANF